MKNTLITQSTEYDCGMVSMINALRYLFERAEIRPDLIKSISLFTLDTFNEHGEHGRRGTSRGAMMYLSNYFNEYGRIRNFPISSCYLSGSAVNLNENTDIYQGLQHGGVAVVRCRLEHEEHYVLLTEIADSGIALFDPYEEIEGYFDGQSPSSIGVIVVKDEPKRYNRIVTRRILESTEPIDYALGPMEHREAILIFNESRR